MARQNETLRAREREQLGSIVQAINTMSPSKQAVHQSVHPSINHYILIHRQYSSFVPTGVLFREHGWYDKIVILTQPYNTQYGMASVINNALVVLLRH